MDITAITRTVNKIAEYLGNSACRAYVFQDEDAQVTFTNSARGILHGIEHQCPVSQLLSDAVEAQETKHGCGCKTLAFMTGIWLLQAQKLLHMGIPVREITAGYDRATDELSTVLEELATPVDFTKQRAVNSDKVSFSKELYPEDRYFTESLPDNTRGKTKNCEEIGNSGTNHFPEDEKVPPCPNPNISLIDPTKHVTKSHYTPQAALKPDASQVLSIGMEIHENSTCAYEDEFDSCFEKIDFRETDLTGKKIVLIDKRNINEVIESGTVIRNNHKQYTGNIQQHGSYKKISHRCSSSASGAFGVELEGGEDRNQTEESFSQEAGGGKLQKVVLSKNNIGNKVNTPLTTRKIENNAWSRYHSKNLHTSQDLRSQVELKTNLSGNNVLSCGVQYYPFTASNPHTKSVLVNINQVLQSFRSKAPYIFPHLQEVYNNQNLKTTPEEKTFESSKIHCMHIGGHGHLNSCVEQGLLIQVSTDDLQIIHELKSPHRILLVNGDLTPHFMHTGSKTIQRRNIISGSYIPPMSSAEKWYGDILSLLKEVTVVFVKGIVDETLLEACRAQNVILISMVPSKVILAIGEVCQVNAATYILECSEADVGIDIHLDILTSDWTDRISITDRLAFVAVKAKGIMFQSVVICHPSEQEALVRQEQFWKCVHSMEHIASKVVLRGGGQTELQCAEILLQRTSTSSQDGSYMDLVSSCVAEGLASFYSVVNRKMMHADMVLYDDLPSKLSAWNTAIQLIKIFLNLSQEIITGISDINATKFIMEDLSKF